MTVYRGIHFYLNAGYVWGSGMDKEKERAFYHELKENFTEAGWQWVEGKYKTSRPEVIKGHNRLNLHPTEVNGELEEILTFPVRQILVKCKTFTIDRVEVNDIMYDWDDAKYLAYLQERRADIEKDIRLAFCPREGNQYVMHPEAVILHVINKYNINRLPYLILQSVGSIEHQFIHGIFQDMVDRGCFDIRETTHGTEYKIKDNVI